jgi:hypothetical protein
MDNVYLMRSGQRYKIGRARDVGLRWRTFRTADPDIRIEHVIPTRQAHRLEWELHRSFNRKHLDLEWFALSPADVSFIKSLGGQSGRWLERQQQRRRFWRRFWQLARKLLTLILIMALLYLAWRVLGSLWPQIQHGLRIKLTF